MIDKIPSNLKSRKLWAFVLVSLLVGFNYVFKLDIPPDSIYGLVMLTATYILGQGYVDGKIASTPATLNPNDFATQVQTIIQAEIQKTGFGKNLPMEQIIELTKNIVQQQLGSLTVSVVAPPIQPTINPDGTTTPVA